MRLLRSIWYVLTLRCEEADRVRASLPREDQEWHQVVGERIHAALCTSCRRARRQIELMRSAVDDMRSGDEPGPGLSDAARERIGQQLEQAARKTH